MIVKPELKDALAARLIGMADDELILGHRNSEWCGHAPILEEDIAFANLALDEIGHAVIWYEALAGLLGKDQATYPDRLVYQRNADAHRCVRFVELPRGDWAFSMLRQYLFDVYEAVLMQELVASSYAPLADAAAKIRQEEVYHLRHTHAWVRRLGLGTDESNRRMQRALDDLWPYAAQLVAAQPSDQALAGEGILPEPADLRTAWLDRITVHLVDSGLSIPALPDDGFPDRSQHTGHLAPLLEELQKVARLDPEATW